jgi:hypothetical protein
MFIDDLPVDTDNRAQDPESAVAGGVAESVVDLNSARERWLRRARAMACCNKCWNCMRFGIFVSVSAMAGALRLQNARLIDYTRGHIRVLDRVGLERRTCECYAVVKKEYTRLLPDRLAA